MGEKIRLAASDGHEFSAYRADPAGKPLGGIIVLQEIFGVNSHIRSICDRLSAEGYIAIAPALFDRFTRDFESGYSPDEVAVARQYLADLDWEKLLLDTRAAFEAAEGDVERISVMGFCLGGSLAFLAGTRFDDLAASVCFYGGAIIRFADAKPLCPTQMHFGEEDHSIPMENVETVRAKRPEAELYIYPAGHGFNCDERASFAPESAALAWKRSLDFLAANMQAG